MLQYWLNQFGAIIDAFNFLKNREVGLSSRIWSEQMMTDILGKIGNGSSSVCMTHMLKYTFL